MRTVEQNETNATKPAPTATNAVEMLRALVRSECRSAGRRDRRLKAALEELVDAAAALRGDRLDVRMLACLVTLATTRVEQYMAHPRTRSTLVRDLRDALSDLGGASWWAEVPDNADPSESPKQYAEAFLARRRGRS